jgi:hypothetical protein
MAQPNTPIHKVAWPIELTAVQVVPDSDIDINALRWRDADGQEGQSSVGEIVHQVDAGLVVQVDVRPAEVVELGGRRRLVIEGKTGPILALPRW